MINPNANLFSFCPGCGKKTLIPDGIKSFSCRACEFKFYLNTAAAGIALIFNPDRQLLVTRRKNEPARDTLDLPGGFIEPDETAEQGLIREVKEELNLDVADLTYFCSVPNQYLYRTVLYSVTDLVFICRVADLTPLTPADDVSQAFFADVATIDPNEFGLHSPRVVIEKLIKQNR